MIKAVIFDIDGVLIDSLEANIQFFTDLMVSAGHPKPLKDKVARLFHLTMKDTIKVLAPKASEEEIEKIWEMGKDRVVEFPNHLINIPEGVEEAVAKLSEKYSLGIVTSRVRDGIYSIPLLLKLQKYFKAEVAYQDTENHKPHPEPLFLICERLGVLPSEAVYIGDQKTDLQAGKAAGMKVMLYSKEKKGEPDIITAFKEIPELILKLGSVTS